MKRNRKRGNGRALALAARGLVAVAGVGAAVAFGGNVAAWVGEHPYFGVAAVEVEGTRAITSESIVARTGIRPGDSLWRVRPERIRRVLLSHPRILAAEVTREFPDRLAIRVEERRPVASVLTPDHQLVVDREGALFAPLPDEPLDALPVITGFSSEDFETRRPWASRRIHDAIAVLERWQGETGWPSLSEVRPTVAGEMIVFPEGLPITIRFGARQRERQFSELSTVFETWRSREHVLAGIDLSVPGQAILKLREEAIVDRQRI